jgi:hypothetical protein
MGTLRFGPAFAVGLGGEGGGGVEEQPPRSAAMSTTVDVLEVTVFAAPFDREKRLRE